MSHNSYNIGTRALPDMYALALGRYRALVPMLQLLNVFLMCIKSGMCRMSHIQFYEVTFVRTLVCVCIFATQAID